MLCTELRNDEASPLITRLNTIKETKDLTEIALNLGLKSSEITRTLRLLNNKLQKCNLKMKAQIWFDGSRSDFKKLQDMVQKKIGR